MYYANQSLCLLVIGWFYCVTSKYRPQKQIFKTPTIYCVKREVPDFRSNCYSCFSDARTVKILKCISYLEGHVSGCNKNEI